MTKHTHVGRMVVGYLVVGTAAVLSAQSSHFTRRTPSCTDTGSTLTCTAELAGLGNEDLTMDIDADALVSTVCVSPGGNEAPGQNPALSQDVEGSTTIPGSAIKNGRATISATTEEPVTPTAEQVGCPNPNWDVRITNVSFSNIVVTIEQGGELIGTCTAAMPGQLSCS